MLRENDLWEIKYTITQNIDYTVRNWSEMLFVFNNFGMIKHAEGHFYLEPFFVCFVIPDS